MKTIRSNPRKTAQHVLNSANAAGYFNGLYTVEAIRSKAALLLEGLPDAARDLRITICHTLDGFSVKAKVGPAPARRP